MRITRVPFSLTGTASRETGTSQRTWRVKRPRERYRHGGGGLRFDSDDPPDSRQARAAQRLRFLHELSGATGDMRQEGESARADRLPIQDEEVAAKALRTFGQPM